MDTRARTRKAFVPLGYISGVHGVAGGVKVHSYTRPREALFGYGTWLVGEHHRPVKVSNGGPRGKTLVAWLEGIEDREQARALVGQEIAVNRSDLPALEPGEFYWDDLIGLEVVNREGVRLGMVDRLMETGANDVLVVKGEREHLVPYVPGRYVLGVDLEAERIEVDWDPEF